MSGAALKQNLEGLERMHMSDLRELWRRRFGAAPTLRSRDLIRRVLAFELQADVHGGLSPELKQRIRSASCARSTKRAMQPGTVIAREWRGERHVVEVTAGGLEHNGATYKNLSEIAREITGARWSGPRFFGLRASDRKPAE